MKNNIQRHVLYIEDDLNAGALTRTWLGEHAPYIAPEIVATQTDALARLARERTPPYDLVLANLRLLDSDGATLLAYIREQSLPLAVVVLVGPEDEEKATAVLKAGADDYLVKRENYLEQVPVTLEHALRGRFEEALRRSEERFRRAFTHAAVGMALVGPDGSALEVNQSICELLGYSERELLGTDFLSITHPDDREACRSFMRRALDGKAHTFQMEKRYIHKHGHSVWVSMNASLLRDDDGRPLYFVCQVQDITERKDAEIALRDSEERFRQLAENIGAAFFITERATENSPGRVLYVSPAYEQIWGRPRETLYGEPRSWFDAVHPEDQEHVRAALRELGKGQFDEEFRIVRPTGKVRWVHDRVFPIRDERGDIYRIAGIVEDITERKQAERALRLSEERLRNALEAGHMGAWDWDPRTNALKWSKEHFTIMGLTPFSVQPNYHTWADQVHPDDLPRIMAAIGEAMEGKGEYYSEYRVIWPDGTLRWVEGRGKPVYDDKGKCIRVGGLVVDITERKLAEEALRKSEKRYRTIFEKANDAILLVTGSDEILEVNQRACELLGYTREEMLTMKIPDLQAPEARGTPGSVVTLELEKYQDTSFEALAMHRTGKRIPIEITNTVVENDGKTLVLSIVRDITERKQIEQQRQEQIRSISESETGLYNFARITGRSSAIQETIRAAQKVAAGDVSPVLITGETGTGKGMIARTIHYASRRAPFAFVMIDCTSIPETLFESELFGYEQGAFTDARKSKRGRLELARGGTLFLDEISEIPLNLQAKLLQVLQEGTFNRIGGREEITLNARVFAATNRDLRAEVAAGRFRADLYQRLFVVQIDVPPLRERKDDILLLAENFITIYNKKYGMNIRRIDPQASDILQQYTWPGNVRELEHAIERAVYFEEGDTIQPQYLRINLDSLSLPPHTETKETSYSELAPSPPPEPKTEETLDQMSATIIKQTVEQCGGNISKAARKLNISRSRIYRLLRQE